MASLPTLTILSLQFLILLIGSYGTIESIGGGVVEEARRGGQQREFDYFQLALQWPGTYCRRTRSCCSSNACCRGESSITSSSLSNGPALTAVELAVVAPPMLVAEDGLWPDYNDGTWPSCCTGSNFDPKEMDYGLTTMMELGPHVALVPILTQRRYLNVAIVHCTTSFVGHASSRLWGDLQNGTQNIRQHLKNDSFLCPSAFVEA
ncbi:unnamed protein product [Ilex paraguariensis]|uniref:Uncharacterized protein n=1 Tax=Ilex paraguariensis TaxID=185542 RepID=A0ABC8U8L2_9AQUA